MPLYEFTCKQCGKDSELLVRSSDWKGTACPKCGSTQLVKKLSVFAAAPAGHASPASSCGGVPSSSCGCCSGGSCGLN